MTEMTPRAHGQGKALPWWLDTRDPEAIRGTTRLRTIDPNLIVGRNRKTKVFEVWGPSLHYCGWVAICECRDDQWNPWYANVPWERVVASLIEARDGMLAPDRAAAHNERLQAEMDARERDRVREGVKYYRRHVQGQDRGYGRHSDQDVADGWHAALSSAKPAPRGQVISIPEPPAEPVKIQIARG